MSSLSCSPLLIILIRSPRKIGRGPEPESVKRSFKDRDYNRQKSKKEEKRVHHNYRKILTFQFLSPLKPSLQIFPPKKVSRRSPQSQLPGLRTLYSRSRFSKSWSHYSRSQPQKYNKQGNFFQIRFNVISK